MNKLTFGKAKRFHAITFFFCTLFFINHELLANDNENTILECNTSPVITCPSNYFGCPGDDTEPANTGYATAIPGESGCEDPVVTYTDLVMSTGPCDGQTLIKRIWFAEYPNNSNPWLFAECTQIILLEDVEAPSLWECPTDLTVDLSANCDATVTWVEPVPADNCNDFTMTSNYSSGDVFPLGTTTVTYDLVDGCGNANSCSFTVTVTGECCSEPPVITCPPNFDLCPSEYVSEACGTCFEDNIISGLMGISQATKTIFQYDISTGTMNSKVFPTLPNTYTIGVTPTNKDEFYFVGTNGNFYVGDYAACTYTLIGPTNSGTTVIGIDVTPLGDVYAVSNNNDVHEIDIATGAATYLFTADISLARDVVFLGMNQIWISGSVEVKRFDINGNVLENVSPLSGFGQGLAIDDCEEIAYYCTDSGLYTLNLTTGTNQLLEDISGFGCNDLDSYLLDTPASYLYYAQENCATGEFMGYVDANGDPYEPVGCSLLSSDCDFTAGTMTTDTGVATAVASSTSCGEPIITSEDVILSTGPCEGEIKIQRIWTATDPDDPTLSTSCDQIINVRDIEGPVFANCPSDIYVSQAGECEMPATWTEPTVTDNCELSSVSSNYQSGDMFPAGTTTVVYTAIDACGNETLCYFNVVVTDNCCNVAPTITCPPNKLACPGTVTSPANMGYATATSGSSSCPNPTVTFSDFIMSSGPCSGQKKIKRTWTATDPSNPSLSSSCEQIIDLKDTQNPVFWDCPDDIWVTSGNHAYWNDPFPTDDCGISSVSSNYQSGDYFPVGTTEVIFTAYDNCGNAATCWFSVVVEQQGTLELTCPADITIGCNDLISDLPLAPTYWSDCQACNNVGYIDGFIYMGSLNGSAYYCSLYAETWNTASSICEANGGYLASIGSAEENAFLANILTLQSAYIGLSDAESEGTFTWTSGEPIEYSNWYPGQPNNYLDDQDYVEMLNNGQWNDQYTSKKLEFILELPCLNVVQTSGPSLAGSSIPVGTHWIGYTATDACGNTASCNFKLTVEAETTLTCPTDITVSNAGSSGAYVNWTTPELESCCGSSGGGYIDGFIYMGSYNGSSYYCSAAPDTWENAQAVCNANGGYLACINDPGENAFLANNLLASSAYIGLNDAAWEGEFVWECGDPVTYQNWYPGQPNNFNGIQDYVELLSNGQWNDQYYYKALEYIMELPNCNTVVQTAGPANGSYFPAGTTTVSYTGSDCCGNTATCSFDVTVESSFCDPGDLDSSIGWIETVMIDNNTNNSGDDGGYGDYTGTCIPVVAGSSYDIRLNPAYATGTYVAYWKIFLDYNKDGDFEDSGEYVAYGSGIGAISGMLTLPYNIWNGDVTLRLVMNVGSYAAHACDTSGDGEIEDYCLSVTGGTLTVQDNTADTRSKAIDPVELITKDTDKISFYPNPSTGILNLERSTTDVLEVEIFNSAGKRVKTFKTSNAQESLDLNQLESGIYFIRSFDSNGTKHAAKKIILNRE